MKKEFIQKLHNMHADYLRGCENSPATSMDCLRQIKFKKIVYRAMPEHVKGTTACGVHTYIICAINRDTVQYTCTCSHYKKNRLVHTNMTQTMPCHHIGKLAGHMIVENQRRQP